MLFQFQIHGRQVLREEADGALWTVCRGFNAAADPIDL